MWHNDLAGGHGQRERGAGALRIGAPLLGYGDGSVGRDRAGRPKGLHRRRGAGGKYIPQIVR
jgi:hypothetical protein